MDKYGQTIDFLLTEHRDTEAALRFLKKAIRRNGLPETITIDEPVADGAVFYRPRPRSPGSESAGASPSLVARG